MKIETKTDTLYEIHSTSNFRKQLKKIAKQGKDINKLEKIIEKLANNETLDLKNKNYTLIDNKYYMMNVILSQIGY